MGPDAMILAFWMLNLKPAFTCSICNLVPWPGIKPRTPALQAQSPSPWTDRKSKNDPEAPQLNGNISILILIYFLAVFVTTNQSHCLKRASFPDCLGSTFSWVSFYISNHSFWGILYHHLHFFNKKMLISKAPPTPISPEMGNFILSLVLKYYLNADNFQIHIFSPYLTCIPQKLKCQSVYATSICQAIYVWCCGGDNSEHYKSNYSRL